jgi:hypothetical protein
MGRERDVDDFVAAKASGFNKSQQLSMSGLQQIQYQSVKNSRIPQRSIGDRIWFGTRWSAIGAASYDAGVFRSLTNREFIDFLEELHDALELAR